MHGFFVFVGKTVGKIVLAYAADQAFKVTKRKLDEIVVEQLTKQGKKPPQDPQDPKTPFK